jgi:hypothetical protein
LLQLPIDLLLPLSRTKYEAMHEPVPFVVLQESLHVVDQSKMCEQLVRILIAGLNNEKKKKHATDMKRI